MNLSPLTAISPIDGRYRSKTEQLDIYFSEFALIRYRVKVEVEYFIALCQLPLPQLSAVSHDKFQYLRDIYKNFSVEDAQHIKDIESITNHDVKAVEYFLKEKFDQTDLQQYKEFIHFGLTSQDINKHTRATGFPHPTWKGNTRVHISFARTIAITISGSNIREIRRSNR